MPASRCWRRSTARRCAPSRACTAPGGAPHPVQQAMAEADATQCGFCTPGFVMSAYAFAAGGETAELDTIHDALAGNLCRCTGYRPIVEAMTEARGPSPPSRAARCLPPRGRVRATSSGSFHRAALARRACSPARQASRGAAAGRRHRSRPAGQPRRASRRPPSSIVGDVPELAASSTTATAVDASAPPPPTRGPCRR